MKHIENILSSQDLSQLSSLAGQKFVSVSGSTLQDSPGHLFSWDRVDVVTAAKRTRVTLRKHKLRFRGFADDYGLIEIHEVQESRNSKIDETPAFYGFREQIVRNVLAIEESVKFSSFGDVEWMLTSHLGFALELDTGAVAIYKAGHQSHALEIAIGDALSDLDITDRSHQWGLPSLGEEYEVTRELIPIDDLLKAAKG